MPQSARSVSIDPKSHPRVEHLRSRRVRHNSFFTNTDSLVSAESASEEDVPEHYWLIIVMTGIIVVFVIIFLTLSGTLIFSAIGTKEPNSTELTLCLEAARIYSEEGLANKTTMNSTEIRQLIHKSLRKALECEDHNKKILGASDAAVYSWSLYSTVGYGDMYMHSTKGQLISILYAFFASGLYLAAELGTIISRKLSDVIHRVRMLARRLFGKCIKFRDPHPHPLQPIARFLICLSLLAVAILILTVYMKIVEGSNWTWTKSLYFSYITMAVIGLGDVVPNDKVAFIIFTQPLLLVGDTLFSQVNWYMQDRLRYGFHSLLRLCQCEKNKPGAPTEQDAYPSVTSKMLPLVPMMSKPLAKIMRKTSKEKRREVKARKKSTNNSLKLIPNEAVFGPDKKKRSVPSSTTTTTSVPATQAKSSPMSAEPITPDPAEVLVEVDAQKREKESLL